jgi:hypothetical protein
MYYRLPPPPPTLETQNSSSEEASWPAEFENKLSFEGGGCGGGYCCDDHVHDEEEGERGWCYYTACAD